MSDIIMGRFTGYVGAFNPPPSAPQRGCPVCGETRCARVDAECKRPCVSAARFMTPAEYHAQFAQQRESAMAQSVFGSAEEWLAANRNWAAEYKKAAAHYLREALRIRGMISVRAGAVVKEGDPDGPHVPLPPNPAPFREYEPQKHDFIGALYRPYVPIA